MNHAGGIVALDSNILIWALKKPEDSSNPARTEACRALLYNLGQQAAQIVIPTHALAEFLVGVSTKDHTTLIEHIRKSATITPLDTRGAAIAAQIYQRYLETKKQVNRSRALIKTDMYVLGSAMSVGAKSLFTTDENFRKLVSKLSNNRVDSPNLPSHIEALFPDMDSNLPLVQEMPQVRETKRVKISNQQHRSSG